MTENVTHDAAPGGERTGLGRRASLRRPVEGRYVGGVSAGIARYFDIDPVLVRVAFVVLAIFGGSGILLYAVGWVVIPEEGAADGPLREWLDRPHAGRGFVRLLAYGALAFVGIYFLSLLFTVLTNGHAFGIDTPKRGVSWLLNNGLQVGFLVALGLGALSVLSRLGRGAGQAGASRVAPASTGLGRPVSDADLLERLRISPRRERSPLGWLTLGVALAVTAILAGLKAAGAPAMSGLRIGAVALLILAIGLVVGAFAGWSRWLVVLCAVLTLGLVPTAGSRLAASHSYRVTPPASFSVDGNWNAGFSSGTVTVDLSNARTVRQPIDTNDDGKSDAFQEFGYISVGVTAGKAIVLLPAQGDYILFAHTSFGTVTMPDGTWHGVNSSRVYSSSGGSGSGGPISVAPSGHGPLQINVEVRTGDIEVRNATS